MHTHPETQTSESVERSDFTPHETTAIMVTLTAVCVYITAVAAAGGHVVAALMFGVLAMTGGLLARHSWNTATDGRFEDN